MQGVLARFGKDKRILGWDLWNEPDNAYHGSYGQIRTEEQGGTRAARCCRRCSPGRARRSPSQPLTSGVWMRRLVHAGKDSRRSSALQLEKSDFVTFHVYDWPEVLERRIKQLQAYGRPIICTEYLARGAALRPSTLTAHRASTTSA